MGFLVRSLFSSKAKIQLPGPSTTANGQRLLVQVTPPNVTYLLTFLATLVSRRDFMGTNSTCRSLVHARAMQEYQSMARADDMWDSDCRLSGRGESV